MPDQPSEGVASLHPAAWIAWLTSIAVFAFVVTNPLYVVLALGAVLVVHLSFPADPSPIGRAVRMFVMFGMALLLLRVVFVALLPNPGRTILLTLPELTTPRWLGGLDLGGPVSAEVVVGGASEGLRLVVVLAAFGVFNARADVAAMLRTVPAAFRDVGLVVSIAVAFVPGMLRTVGDVRDAQRLRGQFGLRRLAPSLVVPVLGLSLERALLLAESMDARGYGRGGSSRVSRMFLWGGLACVLAGVATWASGVRTAAAAVAAAGAAAIVWGFHAASAASPTTRLRSSPVGAFDFTIIGMAGIALVATLLAEADALYQPYPTITWPPFAWRSALVTTLFAVPALAGPEAGR